jgi:hypothetical protein
LVGSKVEALAKAVLAIAGDGEGDIMEAGFDSFEHPIQ